MKNKLAEFNLKDFSRKQYQLLNWWEREQISKNDIVIADGAIRSGKTVSMICSFLRWSQLNFENENFIIAGKSVGSLKRNVINPLRQIVSTWGWHENYNRSGNFIIIGNNTYYLFGANNESSQDVLQGLTSAGALADEIALFPQSFVDQMIGRCSIEGSKIFCNCNPQGPYHYFKQEFIDKASEKLIYYLHFTMDDNLTLSEKVKDRYKRMFSGTFYKRYILGEWVMAEGIIYDMFDEEFHVVDTSNLNFERYYVSIDYGTQNAFSAGLWGIKKEIRTNIKGNNEKVNIGYRIKEYYYSGKEAGKQLDNEIYYQKLSDLIGDIKIHEIIIDPSASSFIATINKHGRFHVKKGNNDVKEGIENTQTALNTKRIYIDKNCKNTIKEFHSYSWNTKAVDRGNEEPLKANDHAMDETRYFVNTILFKSTLDFRGLQ